MNAETLIGTVLGTCTLQKLIGHGGMGAVYLAQQSRPKRQVAVKVLLPMIPLSPDQLAAFLERFRRETDAAAALDHPNIVPVHEYGECSGLAYLVMPYISGGTLRDILEREGPLPLAKAANYLEQLASAIDSAHDHGVIHRDIKPANIMVTPEGRLLLGDFGLVKIITEGQSALIRLTGAGAPVGTPDYMAPEQVIGEEVDTRADLYSLGILLFQMVTGKTPFRGETPMQIAAQHLRLPPPSPLMLRPDLPIRAEQVIKRAMAKKPSDRYLRASDLANAFHQALLDAGIQLEPSSINGLQGSSSTRWPAFPKRQFDPIRQTASSSKPDNSKNAGNGLLSKTVAQQIASSSKPNNSKNAGNEPPSKTVAQQTASSSKPDNSKNAGNEPPSKTVAQQIASSPKPNNSKNAGNEPPSKTVAMPDDIHASIPATPAMSEEDSSAIPRATGGLLSRTGKFPKIGTGAVLAVKSTTGPAVATDGGGSGLLSRTGKFPLIGVNTGGLPVTLEKSPTTPTANGLSTVSDKLPSVPSTPNEQSPAIHKTSAEPETQKTPNTKKVPNSAKVVKTPVAAQLHQFVTRLLPVTPQKLDGRRFVQGKETKESPKAWIKALLVMATLLAIFAAVGILWFGRTRPSTPTMTRPAGTPNATATAMAGLTATARANIILSDPLNRNINNWYTNPPNVYAFKNGAYHITNDNDQDGRASILSTKSFDGPLAYQLTMQEIGGDDTNPSNSFGMIFRFSQHNKKNKNGDPIITFYTFEVVNIKGGKYHFWKYDNTNPDNPWTQIQDATLPLGNEFHQGQGPQAVNTIKIHMNGDKLTITVNGTTLPKTFQDGSLTKGMVGMIVNLKGTEVAFTNLLITKN